MYRIKLIVMALALMMITASACFALPTPKNKEMRVDAYTDWESPTNIAGATGMFSYWCKPQGVNPCTEADFTDAQRVDLGRPDADLTTGELAQDVFATLPNEKHRLCFRWTAYDKAGNESEFGTLAPGEDGCGWFGMDKTKNQKLK